MSETIEMCRFVHFHGFQRPKLRVHPAPEVHDFAIRCINFSSHFEDMICHIEHGADILSRRMFFRGPACDVCIKQFLNPIDPNPAISAHMVYPQSGHIRPEKRQFFINFQKISKLEPSKKY